MDAQLSPSTPTHNDSPFKSILAAAAAGNNKNPHPSFGRGSSNKAGQKFIACANGPPIPLRPDGKRKRVHPTREQQALLETFFQTTPKPNSKERADICNQVNINMRSVQVWFQNRRAKAKKEADSYSHEDTVDSSECGASAVAVSAETESTCPSNLQLEYQQVYQLQQLELQQQTSKPHSSIQEVENHQAVFQQNPNLDPPTSHWTSAPTRILATELCIGTWRRVTSTGNDLVLEINPFEGILRWMLLEAGHTFKIEVPIAYVIDASIHPAPESAALSRVCLDLNPQATPLFYREARQVSDDGNKPTGIFVDSPDFTENQQASISKRHVVEGPSAEMEKLFIILSEYFQAVQQSCHQDAEESSVLSYFSTDAAPLSAMSSMLSPLSMSHQQVCAAEDGAAFNPTFESVMGTTGVFQPRQNFVNNAGLGIMNCGERNIVTQTDALSNLRHLPSPPENSGTFEVFLQRAMGQL